MKPTFANNATPISAGVQTKQSLYNSYANMLLGYLFEAVKDMVVAEQYLVDIFNELQFADIQAITKPGVNTFCQLQMLARKKCAEFLATVVGCAGPDATQTGVQIPNNKFIKMMGPEQQQVFCGIHYHGKTIGTLAAELKQPEEAIRRILKESFTIIRSQCG
nr:hypothetical protein [uncultured Mucilaginibacter sp.]